MIGQKYVTILSGSKNELNVRFKNTSINNCTKPTNRFRVITELAYEKYQKKNMFELYPYLLIGQQLCHSHYCDIIEVDRGQKSNKN